MSKDTTQITSASIGDKTVVIPKDKLPSLQKSTGKGKSLAGNIISPANLLQAFSDLFFSRRSIPDDLISVVQDNPEPASDGEPVLQEAETSENLPDVQSVYNISDKAFATGGQGSISRATDLALGCTVAMKTLHKQYNSNPGAREAFINEARITAELDHPAIIPIHGLFGDSQNGLHLAMKLIEGYTLDKFIQRISAIYNSNGIRRYDERKSLRNRIDILLRVCDAVSYAHFHNIIHRDLKPGNIMIGKYRETYVTDWGIAAHLSETAHLEKVSGTPGYIAPEVITEKKADVRSDVYSLGIILFELTTLSQAFADDELSVLLQKVQQGMHMPLRHRYKFRIDRDLAAIINKAIAVSPEERYQTVRELAQDLRKYLAHEEVSARKEFFWSKMTRWGVNHRRGMMLTTLTALLLGVGSMAYTLQKEFRTSVTQRYLDNAASAVYINTLDVANDIEQRIRSIEYKLETLQMHMRFDDLKIKTSAPGGNYFRTLEQIHAKPPETFVYSPEYKHRIDTENIFIFNIKNPRLAPKDPSELQSTGEYMRKCMRDNLPETSSLLTDPQPVQMIYLALSDGTFACYPGIDKFATGYLPENRAWYKKTVAKPGIPQWSYPYEDAFGNREKVTTCAIAVNNVHGKFIGVAAMDFSLPRLGSQLLANPSKYGKFVCEKMLISPSGKILLRLPNPQRKNRTAFDNKDLIKRMLSIRYGTLTDQSGTHEHLLAFAAIKSLNILYVECIDLHHIAEAINTGKVR